jgi:hypothetical protein
MKQPIGTAVGSDVPVHDAGLAAQLAQVGTAPSNDPLRLLNP